MSCGLVIGIPTLETRPITMDWAMAFKALHPPINFNFIYSIVKNKPVAEARNLIAEEAVRQNAKYLFFIGDDTIAPPHALRQLIFRMENDPEVGVVGGIYFSKAEPSAPLVFRGNGAGSYWDWKIGEYFDVTGLGMDCTLIRTEVFKEISKPWFLTKDEDQFLDAVNHAEQWTEDLYFLEKVKNETQYKIKCDSGIICDHVDVFSGKVYGLPPYSLPTRRLVNEAEWKTVDLGCGPIYREIDGCKPVRVDIEESYNPDYRCDVRNLPFANGEFDIVFSSHVLEHFSRSEWENVLAEWTRILNKNGILWLVLPNIEWAANEIVKGNQNKDVLNVLYGGQSNKFDFHYNGLTRKRIETALKKLDLNIVSYEEQGYNMIIKAKFNGRDN